MKRFYEFLKTTLIGGVTITVPLLILLGVFAWLFSFLSGLLDFVTELFTIESVLVGAIVDLVAIAIIIAVCFLLGIVVRTRVGHVFHNIVEKELLERVPGYSTTWQRNLEKESRLAMVKPFENNTLMTGFVTDSHKDDTYTVFIPTGPNPTSGLIYHLEKDRVFFIDTSVHKGMDSVLHCGEGSKKLIKKYKKMMA
jgi:uncharacterized membrane protein